jgi:glycosyltransferase involved in cell wall biosynthesis
MLERFPTVSVVMPVYNVERYVADAIRSVLSQSFTDLELIVVDDGGSDDSVAICRQLADRRTHIISQDNRGLAGARNTGIAAARGDFIALIDSDDLWEPGKLARHIAHLRARPEVGISYGGAIMIDGAGNDIGLRQRPKIGVASARDVFCGRSVCNGSLPVFRREVLDEISFMPNDSKLYWYFDESLRRSEDVECWTRIALTTDWLFEGIPGFFTRYRVNSGGLSADVVRQLASWDDVCAKVAAYAPAFIAKHGAEARARELRYLARRCVQMRERGLGIALVTEAISTYPRLLLAEPRKTLETLAACAVLRVLPENLFQTLLRSIQPQLAQGAI